MTTSPDYFDVLQEAQVGIAGAECLIPCDGSSHSAADQSRVKLLKSLIDVALIEKGA